MKENNVNYIRESNFELMRIISMFLIIVWHIIIHGHMIENSENYAIKIYLSIIQYIIIVHVNSFMILSKSLNLFESIKLI